MPLLCPRCQRANPAEAVYCHFDGVVLAPLAAGALPPNVLPQEFVFPSGRRCRTWDDLVQGCQYDWEDARDLLKRGEFGPFFARIGRLDLARAAREAQDHADADIALHEFVAGLPATQVQGPRLDLQPRRLFIGPLPAGRETDVSLSVVNQGKGLLQGKLSVSEGSQWLQAGANGASGQVALKTARAQEVTLHVDTRGLVAPQSYSARLTVVSNGGVVDVPVRLDVAAMPFPSAPFQDAGSPRELAERMRASPKAAVPLLEDGSIARWFAGNGWTYPVPGTTAKGVAAVQQFFEYMGLSKPPQVFVAEPSQYFTCLPGQTAVGQVTVRTAARKWVYAEATSDVPWLRVTTTASGPQQAVIAFEIDPEKLPAGEFQGGTIQIAANAGQQLAARVVAEVKGKSKSTTKTRVRRPRSGFAVGALLGLCYRLLLAIPADFGARAFNGGMEQWRGSPLAEDGFLRTFVLATWWVGAAAGIVVAWRQGGKAADLIYGAIAGAAGGLVASATCGCLLAWSDAPARALLGSLGRVWVMPIWLVCPLWVLLASASWAVGGALLGAMMDVWGAAGRRWLSAAAAPVAWLIGRPPTPASFNKP